MKICLRLDPIERKGGREHFNWKILPRPLYHAHLTQTQDASRHLEHSHMVHSLISWITSWLQMIHKNISPSKDSLKGASYWANNWRDPLSPALIYSPNMGVWKRGHSEDARNSWRLWISRRCGALQVPPIHKHSNLEHSHTAAEWLEAIYCTSTGLLAKHTHTQTDTRTHTHTHILQLVKHHQICKFTEWQRVRP